MKKVPLLINDKEHLVCSQWLRLIKEYKITAPEKIGEAILDVVFEEHDPTHTRVKTKFIPVLTKPWAMNGYRWLPIAPCFGISEDGGIYDFKRDYVRREVSKPICKGYPTVDLLNEEDLPERHALHRLVAFAWLPIRSLVEKPIVNHKNGDKCDPHKNNLEWSCATSNARHAVESGLATFSVACEVLDIIDNEVKEFPSLASAAKHVGRKSLRISDLVQNRYRPINKRYEIRQLGSGIEWRRGLGDKKLAGSKTYQLKTRNGNIYESTSMRQLASDAEVNRPYLDAALAYKGEYWFADILVREKTSEPWPIPKERPTSAISIIAKKVGERDLEFKSMTSASKHFGFTRDKLARLLRHGDEDGWTFSREILINRKPAPTATYV